MHNDFKSWLNDLKTKKVFLHIAVIILGILTGKYIHNERILLGLIIGILVLWYTINWYLYCKK